MPSNRLARLAVPIGVVTIVLMLVGSKLLVA